MFFNLFINYLNYKFPHIQKRSIYNWILIINFNLVNEKWITDSIINENLIITLFAIYRRIYFKKNITFDNFKIIFHIIFYITISFCGSEITYKSKHFIKCEKMLFFNKCIEYINILSHLIYKVNSNYIFFEQEKKILNEFIKI